MHLSPIQVPYLKAIYIWKCMCHLHTGHSLLHIPNIIVSPPPPPSTPHPPPTSTPHPHHPPHQHSWCLTSIHVSGFLSHLHPGIASTPSRSKNSSLTMIHIVDHIYQGSISPKCRSKCEFHLHPRPISSPSRPIDSHLASIQVVSHLNPGLYMCVPSPFRWRLSSNQVTKIGSLFHPGNISNQSRSQDVHLTTLQVLPDQHWGPNVLVSPPSMHHQRPNIRAVCYLGLYHLHPSSKNCMSVPSRHHP